MITPARAATRGEVADHYDELDPVYRRLWGEHVHHGLWLSGRETPGQAVEALADLVIERLDPAPGEHLLDIGCGYGATGRRLAAARSVRVTGLTVSAEQARFAQAQAAPGVEILRRDWLDNRLPGAAFDHAYAIESSEHMPDKARFFAEGARVLRPGGRLVVCAWLASETANRWQERHLLEPICREGRLPSMGTRTDYEALAADAGFTATSFEDLSPHVSRTWSICARRFARAALTSPAYLRLLLRARNRDFALSLPRLILAYRTGAMRYGMWTFAKA